MDNAATGLATISFKHTNNLTIQSTISEEPPNTGVEEQDSLPPWRDLLDNNLLQVDYYVNAPVEGVFLSVSLLEIFHVERTEGQHTHKDCTCPPHNRKNCLDKANLLRRPAKFNISDPRLINQ